MLKLRSIRAAASALIAVTALALGVLPSVCAAVTATLPEVSFTWPGPFPSPTQTAGSFSYIVPNGQVVASATISGQWGNSVSSTSAPTRVFLNGNLVATCLQTDPCFSSGPTPWTFTIPAAQLPALTSGTATMTYIQDNPSSVRLGVTTLSLTFATVAIPTLGGATLAALALALAAMGMFVAYRRRHR